MLDLLPSIRFLSHPPAYGPVRMDRFSPYYNRAKEFGLINVRPMAPYKYIYPFDDQSLSRIAYCFDFDYASDGNPVDCAKKVVEYIQAWHCAPEKGALSSAVRPDGRLALLDTRSDATQPEFLLSDMERAAYEYCDSLHSGASVTRYLHRAFPDVEFAERQVISFLDSLVANRLMVTDGVHYLSLAIPAHLVQEASDGDAFLPVDCSNSLTEGESYAS
jgi:hypothetical protein